MGRHLVSYGASGIIWRVIQQDQVYFSHRKPCFRSSKEEYVFVFSPDIISESTIPTFWS